MPRHTPRTAAWLSVLACVACEVAVAPAVHAPEPGAPPPFDAGIDGVYLTQSVQDYAGTVPLVQGRAGLLRVFLRARRPDVAAPAVRVHVVDTATGGVVGSYAATSPLRQVPTAVFEEVRGASWNVAIPDSEVQPGRHLVAEMDPVPGIAPERLRASVRHPAQGSLDVRVVPPLRVTLIPVIQSGLAPDVQRTRTAASWLDRARGLHPLGAVDVLVGAPYTTATVLGPRGEGWNALLTELERKRLAEGAALRHYLGAVRVSYGAGTAGRGDVAGRSTLTWDDAGSYQRVAAHELGHNFGLAHAPCGTAESTSVDASWPRSAAYAGGLIGVSGWDPLSDAVKDPAETWDHMGYCGDDATTWTSDHNYRRALAFLSGGPLLTATALRGPALAAAVDGGPAREPCLLVAGTVTARGVELAPAYVVNTVPALPPEGEYALDLLDGRGERVSSVPFAPTLIAPEAEGDAEEAHFAMAVPLSALGDGLHALAVRRGGVEVARREPASAAAAGPPRAVEVRASAGRTHVRWDHSGDVEGMIRDVHTGEVLAFARGGAAVLHAEAPEVELVLSDGVRSGTPLRVSAR